MKNELNEEIVSAIKKHLPEGKSLLSFLMEVLSIGKKSTYRRLNGEVDFTYEEIAILATELQFSIDQIVRLTSSNNLIYNINLSGFENPEDYYYARKLAHSLFLADIRKSKQARIIYIYHYLPYLFTIFWPVFTKFRYYKWLYETHSIDIKMPLSDLVMSQKLLDIRNIWVDEVKQKIHSTMILDGHIFLSVAKDINYFYKKNLLNDDELHSLKTELLEMITSLETVSKTGFGAKGMHNEVYISTIDLGGNYTFYEFEDKKISQMHIFGFEEMLSTHLKTVDVQLEWLEKIKRYSTLVTNSSEMVRFEYFNKQREYILSIGKK